MTNDDLLSSRSAVSVPDESINRATGSPVKNPRGLLEGALAKMSEVGSVRTRLQTSLPTGLREVLIETVKPDRTHITSPEGEMIIIGRKFYIKTNGAWSVTSIPVAGARSDTGFDFRSMVRQMLAKSGVRVTGQEIGGQTLDGVETVAYELAISDGRESGTIQLCVGKQDGFIRRMFLLSGGLEFKLWFTSVNEPLSIEPPV
jgi:hypothetical protein